MFINNKDERDKLHKIDRDYDIITISFKGKFVQSVRVHSHYRTSVWNAIKSFFTLPMSRIGTHEIVYKVSHVVLETAHEEGQQ